MSQCNFAMLSSIVRHRKLWEVVFQGLKLPKGNSRLDKWWQISRGYALHQRTKRDFDRIYPVYKFIGSLLNSRCKQIVESGKSDWWREDNRQWNYGGPGRSRFLYGVVGITVALCSSGYSNGKKTLLNFLLLLNNEAFEYFFFKVLIFSREEIF